MSIHRTEVTVLKLLDGLCRAQAVRRTVDEIARHVEAKLEGDPEAVMAWEPVPLSTYGVELPGSICSSWVFILRANTTTGAERHPNSRQRMMSYRGAGEMQTRTSLRQDWSAKPLVSDPNAPWRRRWVSIPPNVWHQAVVVKSNWVVVSFHTVPPDELIEERPDPANASRIVRKSYLPETR